MNKYILLLISPYMIGRFYCFIPEEDGLFTDKVCFTSNRKEDPRDWLCKEYPAFNCHNITKILGPGTNVYYRAIIDQSKIGKTLRKDVEDSTIQNYRRSQDFLMIKQEVQHVRVPKTSDTEWSNLWHLNDDVSPSMKISEAWNAGYSGNGIVIAILDDGLQTDHSDLDTNVDTANDIDINDGDNDPSPSSSADSHGTNVGGFIAAERDNSDCTVGVAYQSTILGVRILGGGLTDSQEAQALQHYVTHVDIYSNSWGPVDGYGFSGPDTVTLDAIQYGITNGRGGKGAIYTWASGNGETSDNCNGDGYTNSIYTIAITSVQDGENAWYSEVCAPAMAATYGGSSRDRYLTTTTTLSGCTSNGIQGTSYSTPIASGIIALALQANPNLTWRDVQHLIVLTSTRNGFTDTYSSWGTNGATKEFSQVLGFGLMDAEEMVTNAASWTLVPSQTSCTTSTFTGSGSTSGSSFSTDSRTISQSDCSAVLFLEHVTVDISFSYSRYRGVTEINLVSPSGTESHLMHYRNTDANLFSSAGSQTWTFMSVHFWRESPVGTWALKFKSYGGYSVVTIDSWSLTFYGTSTDPLPGIDKCTDSLCQNNGTCTNLVYSYTCQCASGYTGTNCETIYSTDSSITETINTTESNTLLIVGVVVGVIVFIVIILVIVCIAKSASAKNAVGVAGAATSTPSTIPYHNMSNHHMYNRVAPNYPPPSTQYF